MESAPDQSRPPVWADPACSYTSSRPDIQEDAEKVGRVLAARAAMFLPDVLRRAAADKKTAYRKKSGRGKAPRFLPRSILQHESSRKKEKFWL